MTVFVFRKMLKNKWLVLFLTISALLAITMVASIPIYSNGVMQRVLINEMDNYQYTPEGADYVPTNKTEAAAYQDPFNKVNKEVSRYAGNYIVNLDLKYIDRADKSLLYDTFKTMIYDDYIKNIDLPLICDSVKLKAGDFTLKNEKQRKSKYVYMRSYTNIEDHIKLLDGRLPKLRDDGVIEVLITQSGLKNMSLLCGDEYEIQGKSQKYKAQVVGVFVPKEETATIFTEKEYEYASSLFVNQEIMLKNFLYNLPEDPKQKINSVSSVQWYYVLDYNELTLAKLQDIYNITDDMKSYFVNYDSVSFNIPMLMVLDGFFDKQESINKTLLVIELPILALLGLLIYMLSSLLIEFDKNEISVLRSRGAGRLRICSIYIAEGTIIASISLFLGLYFSRLICTYLGIPNGYLNLPDRSAIQIAWSSTAFIYSLGAAIIIIIAIALPAFFAANTDIVELKRSRVRRGVSEKWKLYCVDLILLGLSAYGYFNYLRREKAISQVEATLIPVDPIIFISVILFIAGCALLFLRIYPVLIMGIFKLTKKVLSPEAFAAFIQVGRGRHKMTFIMLFLIAAMAICLFHANSARTINNSRDDVISYTYGTDLVIMADWTQGNEYAKINSEQTDQSLYVEKEPPYCKFEYLEGTELVTKVYKTDEASVKSGRSLIDKISLIGIEPYKFAQITKMRGDLTDLHYYDYINFLSKKENAVIISEGLAELMSVGVGEHFNLIDIEGPYIDVEVAAILKYWPTYNPKVTPNFAITNISLLNEFSFVEGAKAIKPYEVWMKLKPDTSPISIFKALNESLVPLKYSSNVADAMNSGGKSAMRMGTNGILTLGFIVIISVFLIGFLLYWILSIKSRSLQFGILRSMGMSKSKLTWTLAYEQLMISGAALLCGVFVGGITSQVFIRFYQVAYSTVDQIPPFLTVMDTNDYIRIYTIFGIILAFSFSILGYISLKSKINAAIKLGED